MSRVRFDRVETPAERAAAKAEYMRLRDEDLLPAWSTECVEISEAVAEYDRRQPRRAA